MNKAVSDVVCAAHLTAMGYDVSEALLVERVTSVMSLPLEQFARDLMGKSIHETGHQLMAVWQGCSTAKANLSLVWPGVEAGSMIAGSVIFSGLPDRQSSRRAVAVAGVVAEWLMRRSDAHPSEDEWDLFDSLRDCAWMSQDELELTDGRITWHAVKRASKLLQRHWSIVSLSSASKRKDLLSRLGHNLSVSRQRDSETEVDWCETSRTSRSCSPVSLPRLSQSSRFRTERPPSAMAFRAWRGGN
jgi:hypothetical protein